MASSFPTAAQSIFLALMLGACSGNAHNFSQREGFAEYFAANPRSELPATVEEQALLNQHRPRLYIAADQNAPISFYDDYIAQGTLFDAKGNIISESVNKSLLNQNKTDPGVLFRHQAGVQSDGAVAFGRVDYDSLPGVEPITFLTYHFVFAQSGLPAGLPTWQRVLMDIAGDAEDWHQLDHYTAATLALDAQNRPFALMLQHHNYQRTYLLGKDLELDEDNKIRISAAIGSNELYPWHPKEKRFRAVSFITTKGARYLETGENKPMMAADDITRAEDEVEYRLDFLPPSDAFYSFAGFLGERRLLPGRDGPPGADYNTLPHMKPLAVQLVMSNWREGDGEQLQNLAEFQSKINQEQAFERLLIRFEYDLDCLGEELIACAPKKSETGTES